MTGYIREEHKPLLELYEMYIRGRFVNAKNGKPPGGWSQHALYRAEEDLFKKKGLSLEKRLNIRNEVCLGLLFDAIEDTDTEVLTDITNKVRDPLLDTAMLWLDAYEDTGHSKRWEFIEGVDSRQALFWTQYPVGYIRPIVLLRLVKEHPKILTQLQETSSFYPFNHFRDRKTRITEEEIKGNIAEVLITFFPEDLAERISKISGYITTKEDLASKSTNTLGEFRLPNGSVLRWARDDEQAVTELKELYCPIEVKRVIYEKLAVCHSAIRNSIWGAERYLEGLVSKKSFEFYNSKDEYRQSWLATTNFARNQLMWQWVNGQGIGPTPLTRQLGMTWEIECPESEQERLVVKYAGVTSKPRKGHYLNTTEYLHLCVALLNRYLTAAKSISGS